MAPAGNKFFKLSQASHVKYNTYLPTYLIPQLCSVCFEVYHLRVTSCQHLFINSSHTRKSFKIDSMLEKKKSKIQDVIQNDDEDDDDDCRY